MSSFKCIPHSCDRAREWSSLEVDGELSAFELALLNAHVARCADCQAFRAGVGGVSSMLRAAEPERPSEPIRIPSSARSRFGVQRVLAPLAVAAIVVLTAISATTRLPGTGRSGGESTQAGLPNGDLVEQRTQRRAELSANAHFPANRPGGPQLPNVPSG